LKSADVASPRTTRERLPEIRAADQRSWLIGRGAGCDLVVAVDSVSTRHCRLTEAGGQFFVEDLGSSNGTYVNGIRIAGRAPVKTSDRVTLGQLVPMPWPAQTQTRALTPPPVPAAP